MTDHAPVTPEPREPGEEREALARVMFESSRYPHSWDTLHPDLKEVWRIDAGAILKSGFRRSPASIGDDAEPFTAEDAAKVIDEWVKGYSSEIFLPVAPEHRAKDAVAADLLRDMLPRLAADIRERAAKAALTAVPAKDREDEA